MSRAVLDTSILVNIIKGSYIGRAALSVVSELDECFISVVTIAEINSFMKANLWGDRRVKDMHRLIEQFIIIDITADRQELIDAYILIDGFSKGKLPSANGSFQKAGAIKMGKNDLWIAATALAIEAQLITSDKDFNHLNGSILKVSFFS